jgi:hypothetical protein
MRSHDGLRFLGTSAFSLFQMLECKFALHQSLSNDSGKGVKRMKKFFVTMGVSVLAFGVLAANALAVTVPAIPVGTYGDSLLTGVVTAITAVLPYAAAVTAFAIGVGMLKRWLGHRKATRI